MVPTTSPAADLSRPRLRKMGLWIRDELDPLLARDGPEQLRPDDVLTLHDFFLALRTSHNITALDLRATGIHRAVLDISGIATRWPDRLADDCDKIISTWTAKFGRLDELRPFLYGRGGRLEGIARVADDSNEKLIKRWQAQCPKKIAPARSRQHGDLGFRAGAWWISPLFACHAGMIDLDSVEGGITYDKDAAYALLLKEVGESQDPVERSFTYRCGRNDKGRYRLTAATLKSRKDQGRIRILRSHSMNSFWGPKAGVRYEGLFRVAGWTISSVKTADIVEQENRVGDVIYDIHFERDDPVPMSEVMKTPTTFQVDEYTEYKRLRKVYRDSRRVIKAAPPIQSTTHPSPQIVSSPSSLTGGPSPSLQIRPSQRSSQGRLSPSPQIKPSRHSSQGRLSPSPSRNPTFKRPVKFLENKGSPKPLSRLLMKQSALSLPSIDNVNKNVSIDPAKSEPTTYFTAHNQVDQSTIARPESMHSGAVIATMSNGGSLHSHQSDIIKEVAPWIASEGPPVSPPPETPQPAIFKKELFIIKSMKWVGHSHREDDVNSKSHGRRTSNPTRESRKKSESIKHTESTPAPPVTQSLVPILASPSSSVFKTELNRRIESHKSIFTRSRNPISKLFDGAGDTDSESDPAGEVLGHRRRSSGSISPNSLAVSKGGRKEENRTGSSHGDLLSPTAIRVSSPFWLHLRKSKSEEFVYEDQDGVENAYTDIPQHEWFENSPPNFFPPPQPLAGRPLSHQDAKSTISRTPTRSSAYFLSGFTQLKSRPVVGGEMRAETAVCAGGEGVKGVRLRGLLQASESLRKALGIGEDDSDRDAGGKSE